MSFPTTSVLDDFQRADEGPPPSASWGGKIRPGSNGGLKVVSNQLTSQSAAGCEGYWSAATFGPNSEVYLTIAQVGGGSDVIELWLAVSDPNPGNPDGYLFYAFPGTETVYRVDNDTLTALGASGSMTVANGDSLGFENIGGSLTTYKKTAGTWSSVLNRSDSTYAIGNIGVGLDTHLTDDFGGGTVVTGGTSLVSDTPMPIMGRGASW